MFGAQTLRYWNCTVTFSGAELCCALLGRRELAPEYIAATRDLQGELGESIPPRVLLEEGIWPPQGQKTLQVPAKGLSSIVDRGPEEIKLLLLLLVLHHRFCTLCRVGLFFRDTAYRGSTLE